MKKYLIEKTGREKYGKKTENFFKRIQKTVWKGLKHLGSCFKIEQQQQNPTSHHQNKSPPDIKREVVGSSFPRASPCRQSALPVHQLVAPLHTGADQRPPSLTTANPSSQSSGTLGAERPVPGTHEFTSAAALQIVLSHKAS